MPREGDASAVADRQGVEAMDIHRWGQLILDTVSAFRGRVAPQTDQLAAYFCEAVSRIVNAPGVATVSDLTPRALGRILDALRSEGIKPATTDRIIRYMRMALEFSHDLGFIRMTDDERWVPWFPGTETLAGGASRPLAPRSLRQLAHVRDVNPITRAEAIKAIKDETGLSVRALAKKEGIPHSNISRLLKMLEGLCDMARERIRSAGRFSAQAAEEIASIKDPVDQIRKIEEVIRGEIQGKNLVFARRRREAKASATPAEQQPVRLLGLNASPIVLGRPKPPLSPAQYTAVSVLLRGGHEGCTSTELYGDGPKGWYKVLMRLKASDPDWDAVIQFPGRPHGRYRIAFPLAEGGESTKVQEKNRDSLSRSLDGDDSLSDVTPQSAAS